jgi:Ran GTPase-activating protein (RanGAP) involved in mRNA processing and transport
MRLKEMSATKQAGGKGETEKGKQPAAQKKRARTKPRHSPQTQPLLLADGAFVAALGAVPNEDWCRTWADTRTIMLRMTSKKVNEVLDQMRLPTVVRLKKSFFYDDEDTEEELEFLLRQLAALTARCLITTLALPDIEMKAQDTEKLAGVLAQCPALTHLDLSDFYGRRPVGGAVLAGLPTICPGLVHLYLPGNRIGEIGAGRLVEVLKQCGALVTLDLAGNEVGAAGVERLAGGLASAQRSLTCVSETIVLDQPGQRALLEFLDSANLLETCISAAMRSDQLGQGVLHECCRSVQL